MCPKTLTRTIADHFVDLQSSTGHATCLLVRINGDAYAYSGETGAFTRVPRMPVDLPDQLEAALHTLDSIEQGLKSLDFRIPSKGNNCYIHRNHIIPLRNKGCLQNKDLYKGYVLLLVQLLSLLLKEFMLHCHGVHSIDQGFAPCTHAAV